MPYFEHWFCNHVRDEPDPYNLKCQAHQFYGLAFEVIALGADRIERTKKLKKLHPLSPQVQEAVVEAIRKMTPEEMIEALSYRPPGVPETDMTGMFADLLPKPVESQPVEAKPNPRAKRSAKTV